MATVISNERLAEGVYHLVVEGGNSGEMGQFYMLRAWGAYPLLSRPLSIHQVNDNGVEFLYHVVGEGTEILAGLNPGDPLELEGPFGTGFPQVEGRVALVGGGSELLRFIIVRRSFQRAISISASAASRFVQKPSVLWLLS